MAGTLRYARFTGRIVYVGITKEPILLDDPLFHRRELTLLPAATRSPPTSPASSP
jgi:threonine dehydrogenase-like Zn-dependent dehydrogenase